MPKYAKMKPCIARLPHSNKTHFVRESNYHLEQRLLKGEWMEVYENPSHSGCVQFLPMNEGLVKLYSKREFIFRERE